MFKITNNEKAEIRRYYAGQYTLKFLSDGTVMAKKTGSNTYGILYTPYYTEQHLESIRNKKYNK